MHESFTKENFLLVFRQFSNCTVEFIGLTIIKRFLSVGESPCTRDILDADFSVGSIAIEKTDTANFLLRTMLAS